MAMVVCAALPSDVRAGDLVSLTTGFAAGTIVVETSIRTLYLIVDERTAIRYPVGVGRIDRQWTGQTYVEAKFVAPGWVPPAEIRRDNPHLPEMIAGGAPENPMGAAAMTLAGGDYAIHGTNAPASIGGFVSYGCIRMLNADILDLFARAGVGSPVHVRL
nr:L,D-transpeptidase [Pelagibacterium montanilacus]